MHGNKATMAQWFAGEEWDGEAQHVMDNDVGASESITGNHVGSEQQSSMRHRLRAAHDQVLS